jgi:DNA-binding transcriptional LysR family regulator
MDRLDAMNVFVTAVDRGTLSAASRHLGIPLPTVSRKISELESHLGAQLLRRSSRKVIATDAGREYLEACKAVIRAVEEAERLVAGEYRAPRGDLALSAPICLGRTYLLPSISAFLQAYPEVNVHLLLSDDIMDLQQGGLDLALRVAPLAEGGLTATRIATTRMVVCASPHYLESHGRPKHPNDLRHHRVITKRGLLPGDMWNFVSNGKGLAVSIKPRLVVTTTEAAVDAAIDGVGLTLVPSYQVSEAVAAGQLDVLLDEYARVVPISFVYYAGTRLPLKLRAFLDFVGPRLRERLMPADAQGMALPPQPRTQITEE